MIKLKLIAAVNGDNLGIGLDDHLPWHIPEDLQLFKKMTMGCDMIMGRKTYMSFRGPLPDRKHIVVANNRFRVYEDNVEVVHSIDEAIHEIQTPVAWVIGGGVIYNSMIDMVDELVISDIKGTYRSNRFFPRSWHWINSNFDLIKEEDHEQFSTKYYKRKEV